MIAPFASRFAIVVLLWIALSNLVFTGQWYQDTQKWVSAGSHRLVPEPGYQYADLKPYLKNTPFAGYLTSKKLTYQDASTGNFLEAQFRLAPTVLEVGSHEHPLVIVDGQAPAAQRLVKDLGGETIYINNHNKVLVKMP